MKFSVALEHKPEVKEEWEGMKNGWFEDAGGLSKWRVVNVIDAMAKESGQQAYFVEIEADPLSYLLWWFRTRIVANKRMMLPGWISEKGALKS